MLSCSRFASRCTIRLTARNWEPFFVFPGLLSLQLHEHSEGFALRVNDMSPLRNPEPPLTNPYISPRRVCICGAQDTRRARMVSENVYKRLPAPVHRVDLSKRKRAYNERPDWRGPCPAIGWRLPGRKHLTAANRGRHCKGRDRPGTAATTLAENQGAPCRAGRSLEPALKNTGKYVILTPGKRRRGRGRFP
ncbi:MAG: hypothetical protein MAG794_00398 [Gammaproteobacteria bacterium]|nr:hypothetical protein [Gammaproteobacteria bacterium]